LQGEGCLLKELNWIAFIKIKGNVICSVAFVFVILVFSLQSILEAYFTLPSFDGAMNLQVPVNLLKYGRYATSYNAIVDFDHRIQSGAPLLLPIYFLFLIFGTSAFAAQLVSGIYLILTALAVYYLTLFNANRFFALVCLLLFILTPSLLQLGHHVWGEIPALFYLLSSLALLYRLEKNSDSAGTVLPLLTGLLYGLSYLTKTVMLIAVPSIIFFFIIDFLFIYKLKKRHYLLILIGFILPIAAFECFKIAQIGADAYPKWWKKQSSSIISQAGVKKTTKETANLYETKEGPRYDFKDTENVYEKMLVHSKRFCECFRMNTLVMLFFLCVPLIIFIIHFLYHFIKKKRDHINVTSAILYGTAGSYMVWWIFITPTAKAWHRRIISGYILQEIVLVISLYFLWKFLSTTKNKVHFSKRVAGGIVFTIMLFFVLYQYALNSKQMKFLFSPSQGKIDAERIAETIEMLPERAKIYGAGWWQSPTLSFLSNRMFLDILSHRLPEYPVKLQDTYFVLGQPDTYVAIDHPDVRKHVEFLVLNKTKNRLIEQQGDNYLYQIEYKSDYSYATTYKINRTGALFWLAERVKPTDTIVIAEELQIDDNDQMVITLWQLYKFVRRKRFKQFKREDLLKASDDHILKTLQRSPEFVFEKPDVVSNFFKTNQFKIVMSEIIIKKGSEITEEWITDTFSNRIYVVGYDTIVVDDKFPFHDPQFRRSLKVFPLSPTKPLQRFWKRSSLARSFSKEPKVNIYKFDTQLIR
jgi:hypothetical protein